jgi:hypothetical protein
MSQGLFIEGKSFKPSKTIGTAGTFSTTRRTFRFVDTSACKTKPVSYRLRKKLTRKEN